VLTKRAYEYFEGKRADFTVPLQLVGTPFQQSVWKILMSIPYASTISYKEEALLLKNPKAVRAVGSANGKNTISIIIPCHRVISKSAAIGGYRWGIERKKILLSYEENSSWS